MEIIVKDYFSRYPLLFITARIILLLSSLIGVYIMVEDYIMREKQKEERKKYPFASFITNFILIVAAIIVISFFIEGITHHI